jgi:hypothetical protein
LDIRGAVQVGEGLDVEDWAMNEIEHVGVAVVVVEVINCLELARQQMKPLLEGLEKVGRREALMTLQPHLFVETDPSGICGRDLERDLLDEGTMSLTLLELELRRETLGLLLMPLLLSFWSL